ncbi:putative membrane protein YdjX (TVP38/TMEM64 family) [Pseudonocardia sediminis]|uniref:TVP38/TMEM64 family membrane protein n=1 Tax=Pseudonocardia sediminis TaxID=1397368 RepID=A0A4Q7UQ40_PSEST|nr:VTT domain-containing protein [Pseudonocardia sediminis]RZT83852.1 putative membrane protein YdjX (TVP38/TMEM64 family) [Pseudonocardia sediminis]
MRGRRWVRPVLLLVLVAAGGVAVLLLGVPTLDQIRERVDGAGWAGPLVFAALYAGLSLVPAPVGVLSIGAGVLFGLPVGLAAALAGALAGALGAFGLARGMGRAAVADVGGERLGRLDALLRRRGLLAVVGVRLVPLLPFTALNYACGLTAVRLRDYAAGTVLGILPGATAYVAIGAYGASPGSVPFLLGVGGLVVLSVGGLVVARRRRAAGT